MSERSLRLALAQMNPTVGDLSGNVARACRFIAEAERLGVDLVCFPELALTGCPPEDLLLRPDFVRDSLRALQEVVEFTRDKELVCVIGFVDLQEDLYNAAAVIHRGQLRGVYHKVCLSSCGVFDEERYFRAGRRCPVFVLGPLRVGVSIREDLWYPTGPVAAMVQAGAELIVNVSAWPFQAGGRRFREQMLATRAVDHLAAVACVNMVGGQDELVFDGSSLILDQEGRLLARGRAFEEDLVVADLSLEEVRRARLHGPRWRRGRTGATGGPEGEQVAVCERIAPRERPPLRPSLADPLGDLEEVYAALVLGTRDYVRKNGFSKAVVGLSGGIDSSLVATLAVDALGAGSVVGVSMPSRFSSEASVRDAEQLARNLGIELLVVPIEAAFRSYLEMLAEPFAGTSFGVAEENLQARIRGNILMALSNKFGWLVLTTGNKSEMACGYATLYGDMAGGFAVIKDVPKTMVYELARLRNRRAGRDLIPTSVLEKPPSAELRPGQRDTDALPPYEVLDPILRAYLEEHRPPGEIVEMGFDEETVRRVISMVDRNEYKRRQAPPGVRITRWAFGKDRRLPITNRYRPGT